MEVLGVEISEADAPSPNERALDWCLEVGGKGVLIAVVEVIPASCAERVEGMAEGVISSGAGCSSLDDPQPMFWSSFDGCALHRELACLRWRRIEQLKVRSPKSRCSSMSSGYSIRNVLCVVARR